MRANDFVIAGTDGRAPWSFLQRMAMHNANRELEIDAVRSARVA